MPTGLILNLVYNPQSAFLPLPQGALEAEYRTHLRDQLGIPLHLAGRARTHVKDLVGVDLTGNPISVVDHCYGCTAGQGSSCTGAL